MDRLQYPTSSTHQAIDDNTSPKTSTTRKGNVPLGIWRLCDPKISLASLASIFLGSCAAAVTTPIHWGWLALTVVAIFCLETAKNASGEVFDLDADTAVDAKDISPFSGGKRVIVDGLMTKKQTAAVAALFYLHGIVAGLMILVFREPGIFFIGLIGIGLAYFYNAPPARIPYRGFGEIAVAITYGPLICNGTYLVQQNRLSPEIVLLSIPTGILISALLVINEFPNRLADRAAGKKNLIVRLSDNNAEWLFIALIFAAYLLLLALPFFGIANHIRIGLIGLPFGIMAAIRLLQTQETARIIPAQKWTLISFVLTAMGSGIGLLV